MNLQKTFTGILPVLFSLFIVPIVFAHGDRPRLEISLERTNPGGVIDVRGVDFEFEEVIMLDLVGSDVAIPLGESVADAEGIFVYIVTLPVELKSGMYQFRATTDDHVIMSPSFEVWGTAVFENEEGEEGRDEDDGLNAPMPTNVPGVSVTPVLVVEEVATPIAAPASSFPWVPVTAGVGVFVVLFLAIFLRRGKA